MIVTAIVVMTIDGVFAQDDRDRLRRTPCRSPGRGVDRPRQAFTVEMILFVFNENGLGAEFEIVTTRSRTPIAILGGADLAIPLPPVASAFSQRVEISDADAETSDRQTFGPGRNLPQIVTTIEPFGPAGAGRGSRSKRLMERTISENGRRPP